MTAMKKDNKYIKIVDKAYAEHTAKGDFASAYDEIKAWQTVLDKRQTESNMIATELRLVLNAFNPASGCVDSAKGDIKNGLDCLRRCIRHRESEALMYGQAVEHCRHLRDSLFDIL